MVMEKPSPLLVGREFVRQYYTLLNKAPDYLHRFYGRNSSYVHGGVDGSGKPEEAVYGQAEIHKKVMSLQFNECHTKIRQVDAHATLGDGVVVQVMGELSNSGRPMRRFMQTFVLAPESLRKRRLRRSRWRLTLPLNRPRTVPAAAPSTSLRRPSVTESRSSRRRRCPRRSQSPSLRPIRRRRRSLTQKQSCRWLRRSQRRRRRRNCQRRREAPPPASL
uniref:G3BP stress granule assembly factor 2 n=1 Tax=Cyprinus carpio carpio TaxID=630221 RepID=A0A9J8D1C2_CYPCA